MADGPFLRHRSNSIGLSVPKVVGLAIGWQTAPTTTLVLVAPKNRRQKLRYLPCFLTWTDPD
jgi:hypothetical protein